MKMFSLHYYMEFKNNKNYIKRLEIFMNKHLYIFLPKEVILILLKN